MGKKLDAILGRSFKTSKFKPLANLALSRILVLKNQRQVRCNQARSDALQLLQQGHHDRALLRVEQVIKEQNMVDVFVMLEGYINLLMERVHLVEQERICPKELKEAVGSLVFASTRCGEFPELLEIRAMITSRYGKEFVAGAIELRSDCGVNVKIIQKLSTRQPDLDSRIKVLKEIATENSIVLELGESSSPSTQEKLDIHRMQNQTETEEMGKDGFSDSVKARRKYRDVADAAQAAFESAAHAAAAARAAVELSRSDSHNPDDKNSPKFQGRKVSDKHEPVKLEPQSKDKEIYYEDEGAELNAKTSAEIKRSGSSSGSDSEDDLKAHSMSSGANDEVEQLGGYVGDEIDDDLVNIKSSKLNSAEHVNEKSNKQIPLIIQAGIEVDLRQKYPAANLTKGSGMQSSQNLTIKKGPVSVRRTRQVRGY